MKVIGIVGRVYYNRDNQDIIQIHEQVRKAFVDYDDVCLISILPTGDEYDDVNQDKLDYVLDMCDGFVVPGGTYFYELDEYVINYAIKMDKPLLAICLGFQAMCSVFAVNRDKKDMTKRLLDDKHYGKASDYIHQVFIDNNSLLFDILGSDEISVNSVHHDYIDIEMNKLRVIAKSSDDIIEAVEYPHKRFILGVQWHPEYLVDDNSKKIFDYFIKKM